MKLAMVELFPGSTEGAQTRQPRAERSGTPRSAALGFKVDLSRSPERQRREGFLLGFSRFGSLEGLFFLLRWPAKFWVTQGFLWSDEQRLKILPVTSLFLPRNLPKDLPKSCRTQVFCFQSLKVPPEGLEPSTR